MKLDILSLIRHSCFTAFVGLNNIVIYQMGQRVCQTCTKQKTF